MTMPGKVSVYIRVDSGDTIGVLERVGTLDDTDELAELTVDKARLLAE